MKNLKNFLPLFALILGFTLVFTQSAFKATKSEKRDTLVFQYTGTTFNEGAYETASNWTVAPNNDDCPGAGNICKLSVEEDDLSGSGTLPSQLAAYLASQPGATGATNYIINPAHRVADQN